MVLSSKTLNQGPILTLLVLWLAGAYLKLNHRARARQASKIGITIDFCTDMVLLLARATSPDGNHYMSIQPIYSGDEHVENGTYVPVEFIWWDADRSVSYGTRQDVSKVCR